MSTSDQVKSKLLNSMRVSKEGTKEVPVAEKAAAPVKKTAPANKAKTAKTTKKADKPAASKETVTDSFQAARRVWPD